MRPRRLGRTRGRRWDSSGREGEPMGKYVTLGRSTRRRPGHGYTVDTEPGSSHYHSEPTLRCHRRGLSKVTVRTCHKAEQCVVCGDIEPNNANSSRRLAPAHATRLEQPRAPIQRMRSGLPRAAAPAVPTETSRRFDCECFGIGVFNVGESLSFDALRDMGRGSAGRRRRFP